MAVLIIRNPKKKIEKYRKFSFEQVKLLWRQKFNTYSVIMASVFLGISWNFLSTSSQFLDMFNPLQVGVLLLVWILSGTVFGVGVAYVVDRLTAKNGTSWLNDITFKLVISLTLVGYSVLGILQSKKITEYWIYVLTMIVLGVGNLGSFGLVFLSFIETLYPINSLVIGTIIAVGASFYSTLIQSLSDIYFMNVFYFMAIGLALPWIYITVVYKTNFKRYKYYLN